MDVAQILSELWRQRIAVALCALAALVAGVLTISNISLFPPSISSKSETIGTARTQVMVDSPRSPLVELGSIGGQDFVALNVRAQLYVSVWGTLPVRREIAKVTGLPVADSVTQTPGAQNSAQAEAEGGAESKPVDPKSSIDPNLTGSPYSLTFQAKQGNNIVSLFTQAPTPELARRYADGAVVGFQDYLEDLQDEQNVAPHRRVQLRQLAPATGGTTATGTPKSRAVLVFLGIFGLGCLAILGVGMLRDRWEEAQRLLTGQPRTNGYSHAEASEIASGGRPQEEERETVTAEHR